MRTLEWDHKTHATTMVVLLIALNVLDRVIDRALGASLGTIVTLALLVALFFSYRRAQVYINIACGDPKGASNDQLTGANYAWIAVGVVFWLLIVVGVVVGDKAA